MRTKNRILACTPVCFKGDHTFFSRDSGLLSVGLSMNGIDSIAVMPGPSMPEDDPRLIRTDYRNLSDAAWWQEQSPDAVIFFSWAMPQYTPIARAIKASGAKLLVFLDSAGFWSPWSNGVGWFETQWDACRRKRGLALGLLHYMASIGRSFIPSVFDRPRLEQMNIADAVTVTSPLVLERTKRYAHVYGFEQLERRIYHLPLPVSTTKNTCSRPAGKRSLLLASSVPPVLLLASSL
jgi:hypothetical protein